MKYLLAKAGCRCSVYPVALGFPIGRCGRCGAKPKLLSLPYESFYVDEPTPEGAADPSEGAGG